MVIICEVNDMNYSNKFFDIGQIINLENRIPVGIIVTFKPEALFKVGVLKSFLEIIAEKGFPLLYLTLATPKVSEPILCFLVIDATDRTDAVMSLVSKLKNHQDVQNVEILKPLFDGYLVNTIFDFLTIADERSVIFRRTIYEAFLKTVREFFGTGGGALLYHIGSVIGRKAFENHIKITGGEFKKLLTVSEALFKASGFGEAKIIEVDIKSKQGKVKIKNNFECELFKNANEPSSHFVRGLWAGWFEKLFGKEVKAIETKCIAKGDKYCEFEIR